MANYSICTQTFDIGDEPKAKALKPLEEAAEVFGAWQNRCDQCEAVCSFACKKIAFGDIESRIRKLRGEVE